MADERNPKVSRRYRELEAEEPPRKLDQSILAAAHRAAAARHRWYFAAGAAAILLLAVGITLHLERDRPPASMEERTAAPPASAPQVLSRDAVQAPREEVAARAAPPDTPERWVERIVQLRKDAKHDEADRQLAELRRSYPDYKVPEAALRSGK